MIKKFNEFNEDKNTMIIFDLDNTLAITPTFNELSIEFLKENITIENLLKSSVRKIGVTLSDLKVENGRIFVEDPTNKIIPKGNWVKKGKRVYIYAPEIFHTAEISFPKKASKLLNLYNSTENKCIVTARSESVREKITKKLEEFGLKMPKYGIHMAPIGTKNLGTWKGIKIVEILKETGFKKAKFYDDNAKYLTKATRVIKEELPNIDWQPIKVNIN